MYPHMITIVEMRNIMIINRSAAPAAITPINTGRGREVSAFGRKERIRPPPLSCVGGTGVDTGRSDAGDGLGMGRTGKEPAGACSSTVHINLNDALCKVSIYLKYYLLHTIHVERARQSPVLH